MRLYQILTEDVSKEASIKTITDVLSTELPELYRKLSKMAENYYEGHGELGKGFRFISGGQKSQWYHETFTRHLRPSLYNLSKVAGSDALRRYLSDSVGQASFSSIENTLLGILKDIAEKNKISVLHKGVMAAIHARDAYLDKLGDIEASGDDYDEPKVKEPKQPNAVGQQNAAVENIINDVLSRIDRRTAGEIRQAISRSGNKLQALQQELARRNLNP